MKAVVKVARSFELNFFAYFVKNKKIKKKYMRINLKPHAHCKQSLKFKSFVDPEKSHLQKKVTHPDIQFDISEPQLY